MKTLPRLLLFLVIASLGPLGAHAEDEPGVERWKASDRVKTFSDAKKVTPKDLVTMRCKDCSASVSVVGSNIGSTSESRAEWHTVGAKLSCSECKGELTVVQGKDADDMKINCTVCGEGSVLCFVAPPEKK